LPLLPSAPSANTQAPCSQTGQAHLEDPAGAKALDAFVASLEANPGSQVTIGVPSADELEIEAWRKLASKFDPKTDLLIVPRDSDEFVEKALECPELQHAMDKAATANKLITVRYLISPALLSCRY
jgi:hypothetical protein